MSTTRTYTVVGMSCAHCASSVRDEVSEIAGVASVDVDYELGRLRVSGHDFTDEAVEAAVEEAGYELSRAA